MSHSSRSADDPEQLARALDGPAVPPEFEDNLRVAEEADQRYQRSGDRATLDSAAVALSRLLEHVVFPWLPERFRLRALE